jgi:uncharacterized protein with von Willebrand factor type A (vWA) domain
MTTSSDTRTGTGTLAPRQLPDEVLLAFTRALRAAGLPVTPDRAHTFLAATAELGLDDAAGTRRAGRATLCSGPDDLARFDQVFEAWFDPRGELPRPVAAAPDRPDDRVHVATAEDSAPGGDDATGDPLRAAASATEVLRRRDIAGLSAAERRRLAALFESVRPRAPRRRTARHQPWHRGDLDVHRTLRASLRHVGEPAQLVHRRRGARDRRVVLLLDVSGSMGPYADALLRLAHRFVAASPAVEVFTVGTRVTQVTRALRHRDPDRAIVAAGEAVPDWSGGTRLGESLRFFLERWGRRGLARGAVVVVFSDGWERGDAALLGEQMALLQRVAHRVVWVNPHRGKAGYEPLQAGVVAALPHVHDFLAGHSLATFEELTEVVARA